MTSLFFHWKLTPNPSEEIVVVYGYLIKRSRTEFGMPALVWSTLGGAETIILSVVVFVKAFIRI